MPAAGTLRLIARPANQLDSNGKAKVGESRRPVKGVVEGAFVSHMDGLYKIDKLLAKGRLDAAIQQAEEWWGPAVSLDDRVPHFCEFLSERYHESLAPGPCRLVYLNFDDPSEALREPGDLTVWVELYEKTPSLEEMEARAGGGDEYAIPVADLQAADVTVLYGMRMALSSMLRFRQEEHPLGSAELRVGVHDGDDHRLLKKIKPFPCPFDFDARVQEVESALKDGQRARALSVLSRMPGNLQKAEATRCRGLWESALEPAKAAQSLSKIALALEELAAVKPTTLVWRLTRDLHLRAARLHIASQAPTAAISEYYRAGDLPPEAVLGALGLTGTIRAIPNCPHPTYFRSDLAEPCTFGLAEIVNDRLEWRRLTTLPLEVYRILEECFDFFNPVRASESLTRAAFHAFQAGYGSHAAYLARKACELDPGNTVASRSRQALLAKGIAETGSEADCLETVLTGKVAAHGGLRRLGVSLA